MEKLFAFTPTDPHIQIGFEIAAGPGLEPLFSIDIAAGPGLEPPLSIEIAAGPGLEP
ncbi:hypothetical protein SAMN04244573_04585, partial [Azotobacter beijerinckii]